VQDGRSLAQQSGDYQATPEVQANRRMAMYRAWSRKLLVAFSLELYEC
jgi:hypothetical protein